MLGGLVLGIGGEPGLWVFDIQEEAEKVGVFGCLRMGRTKKKKKSGGGGSGRRGKGRTQLKDHAAHVGADDNELLSEEITAL